MNIRHSVSCQNVLFSYQGSDSSEETLFLSSSTLLADPTQNIGSKNHTHPSSISEIKVAGLSGISKTHSWLHGVRFSHKQNEIPHVKLQTSATSLSE